MEASRLSVKVDAEEVEDEAEGTRALALAVLVRPRLGSSNFSSMRTALSNEIAATRSRRSRMPATNNNDKKKKIVTMFNFEKRHTQDTS